MAKKATKPAKTKRTKSVAKKTAPRIGKAKPAA